MKKGGAERRRSALEANTFSAPKQDLLETIDFTNLQSVTRSMLDLVIIEKPKSTPIKPKPVLAARSLSPANTSAQAAAAAGKSLNPDQSSPTHKKTNQDGQESRWESTHQLEDDPIYVEVANTPPNKDVLAHVTAKSEQRKKTIEAKQQSSRFLRLALAVIALHKKHNASQPQKVILPEAQDYLNLLDRHHFAHAPEKAAIKNAPTKVFFDETLHQLREEKEHGYVPINPNISDSDQSGPEDTPVQS